MEGVTPNKVLESLMHDGTFDSLRQKLTAQLKSNEELKTFTTKLVETSRVLNAPGAEQRNRRDLFDALRKELEPQVLERASREAWQLILCNEGLGKEIARSVDSMYCQLSGLHPPSTTDGHDFTVSNEKADNLV